MTTLPPRSDLAHAWTLDPEIVFLNHGSFGGCLRTVLEAQSRYRAEIEREPVRFFNITLWERLDHARAAVAEVMGGDPADYVFCRNATEGVATMLENAAEGVGTPASRPLQPGDELLTFNHEYPACMHNLHRLAGRRGCTVRTEPFPVPPPGEPPLAADALVEYLLAAVSDTTRLVLVSHITSPSGVVIPIDRLTGPLAERGVAVIVDGAHGPGATDFQIPALGAPFYTFNAHKWFGAPKGAGVLWVRPDLHDRFRPLVLSNDATTTAGRKKRSHFNLEFDYVGTDDPTAKLAVADAIHGLPELTGTNWPGIIAANRDLVLEARALLAESLGLRPQIDPELIGPLAMLPLPDLPPDLAAAYAKRPTQFADPLQDALLERHKTQVPIWRAGSMLGGGAFDGRRFIRLSAQRYNTIDQYRYLADALRTELEREQTELQNA